jgi:hypothetical protein
MRNNLDLPPEKLVDSTLFWLSVLRAARQSEDTLLESVARRRLAALGTRVVFNSERPDWPHINDGGRTDA